MVSVRIMMTVEIWPRLMVWVRVDPQYGIRVISRVRGLGRLS